MKLIAYPLTWVLNLLLLVTFIFYMVIVYPVAWVVVQTGVCRGNASFNITWFNVL